MSIKIEEYLKLPSPLEKIDLGFFGITKHEVWVKRDDLIHECISGNKWRKLKYNIQYYFNNKYEGIVSFGGAYSNHVAALGQISKDLNIPTTIIIRGERPKKLNPTLIKTMNEGVDLRFVTRAKYLDFKKSMDGLTGEFPNHLFIPEGASNEIGMNGCKDIVEEIKLDFDEIFCDVGTGATCAGISKSLKNNQHVIGIVVLKGAAYIEEELEAKFKVDVKKITLKNEYHFGGYAKNNRKLIEFMKIFYEKTGIKTDPIYSGKMFYGLINELQKTTTSKSKRIIALHSGGLQGISGFEDRFSLKIY